MIGKIAMPPLAKLTGMFIFLITRTIIFMRDELFVNNRSRLRLYLL